MNYHLPQAYLLKNRYRIEGVLGQGGFGITYVAYDVDMNCKVCIKELFIAGNSTRGSEQTVQSQATNSYEFEDFIQRFMLEAKQLAAFDHPGVVAVKDIFEANHTAYMVMEFVEGSTLKDLVNQSGPMQPQVAFPLLIQLMEAVEVVHHANMLHRDIKPDNVIITPEQRVVLIDFGSARAFSEGKTTTQTTILTPGYAPPEQYSERAPRGAFSDVYALGATLYFLLTGQKPYAVTDRVNEKMPAPHQLNPNISTQISSAIMLAMQLRPQDRFQTVQGFKNALLQLDKSTKKQVQPSSASIKEEGTTAVKILVKKNKRKVSIKPYIPEITLLFIIILGISYLVIFQPAFISQVLGNDNSSEIQQEKTNKDSSPKKGSTTIGQPTDYSYISGGYQYADEFKRGYFICEHLNGKQFNYSIRISHLGGCKGNLSGRAAMIDQTTAIIKNGNCTLNLRFHKNGVYINENPECDQHSPDCTFSGKYLRVNPQETTALKNKEKAIRAEQNSPLNYLAIITSEEANSNLILESVIKGQIKNSAKYTSYDTFRFKIDYYDRLGGQLGTKYAAFKQIVYPGQSINYKIKVRMPLKANTFKVTLVEAN